MTRTRSIQKRLLVGTAMVASSLLAYGRRAYAGCTPALGTTYLCRYAGGAQTINADNANVVTMSGFSVNATGTDDAITVTGDGAISFTDYRASTIHSAGGRGLLVRSTGDAGTTAGSVTILTGAGGNISGDSDGIVAENYGSGDVEISTDATVEGQSGDGIHAYNSANGGGLTITTGADSTVTGDSEGIYADQAGNGPLDITINGDVSGGSEGIYARNQYQGSTSITVNGNVSGSIDGIEAKNLQGSNTTDLTITVAADASVSSDDNGIYALNGGTGELHITVDGYVSGGTGGGIHAQNEGTDLTIDLGADSTVTAGTAWGVYGRNLGTGNLVINANGDIAANPNPNNGIDSGNGIRAQNSSNGKALTITTAAGHSVSGGFYGISAENNGSGALTITTNGDVTGRAMDGIYGRSGGAGALIIEANGDVSGGRRGIYARNQGSSYTRIVALGEVTGASDEGIYAHNWAGSGDLTITTGVDSSVTGGTYGIRAINYAAGDLEIEANGDVTGLSRNGIHAQNSTSGGTLTITTGAGHGVSGYWSGIQAYNGGSGDLVITTNGDVTGQSDDGIDAFNGANGGDLIVTTGASSTVKGLTHGIWSVNDGSGALTITANGDVTGQLEHGIYAGNTTNGGALTVTIGIDSSVTGYKDGIRTEDHGDGPLTISADGDITGSNGDGIHAYNSNGGDSIITTGADSTVTGHDRGIYAYHTGDGDLQIEANGDIVGSSDDGIFARNLVGNSALTITTGADSSVTGGTYGVRGINTAVGDTEIEALGDVTGSSEDGIHAYSSAYGYGLTVTTGAGHTVRGDQYGIWAEKEAPGALTITADGDVIGSSKDGIYAYGGGDSSGVTITTGAGSSVTGRGHGIYARGKDSGTVRVTGDGKVTGQTGAGIHTFNTRSGTVVTAIAVGTTGEVQGASAAIVAQSSGGLVSIQNSGFIHNVSGLASDLAIKVTGGLASVTNSGRLVGRIAFGTAGDLISSTGVWSTSGDNDFGDGDDLLVNLATGMLFTAGDATAAETTSFSSLETFINLSTLSLHDGGAGDTTTFSGDFLGTEDSTIVIDTELGGDGSPTDLLVINGNSYGNSTLVVDNAGGRGGATIGDGIRVVEVDGISASDAFTLGQPVTAGIYRYDLYYGGIADPTDGDWYLRSTLAPSANTYLALPRILLGFNQMPTLAARLGGRAWSGPEGQGLWMRMDGGQGTFRSNGALSGAFDSNWREMEAGADFDLADTFAGGRLVGGITAHADWLNANLSPAGVDSSLDGTGYGVGATLTWYGPSGFYVDSQAKATWFNADIGGSASSAKDIDGLGYALGIEAGRHIRLGGGWSLTPQAQLVYSRIDFDAFTDSFNADVSLRRGESLRGRAGLAVGHDFAFSRSGWQAGVYGLANIGYEALGDTSVIAGGAALDWEPQRLWGDVGLGASIEAGDGVSFFGEATYAASLEDFSASHTLTGRVGLRLQW